VGYYTGMHTYLLDGARALGLEAPLSVEF